MMRADRMIYASIAATPLFAGAVAAEPPKRVPELKKIKHVIVIYLENRSFDHLYGLFPGADGIANAGEAAKQVATCRASPTRASAGRLGAHYRCSALY